MSCPGAFLRGGIRITDGDKFTIVGCLEVPGDYWAPVPIADNSDSNHIVPQTELLVRAFKDRERRFQKNLDVQPDRPGGCIPQVHTNHLVEFHAASSPHLPQTSNSRLGGLQTHPMPGAVAFDFVRDRRSWTD